MTYTLPELGYEYDALEPHLDKETMEIHHSKHHQGYVDKLNAALEGKADLQDKDVDELLKDLDNIPEEIRTAIRNAGGGHANHTFFWPLMKKDVACSGAISEAINAKFGSFDAFKEAFIKAALGVFGSGWAWLVINENKELEIMTTANQDSPLSQGKMPVLGVDVWEHSYYKKFGPKRNEFLEAFFQVIDWDKVNEHLSKANQ
ncbi:superoxide dismutase [archaeon]|nr:superoxide dismutase [archaeon]|tara:strand:+ start:1145 stop:1753 length:609 start_codon:yes stop_codon:yes gene_type:complete